MTESISWWSITKETVKTILIVGVFALLIRTFLVQPFIVEGRSMETNYEPSDYLLIDKLTYRLRDPHRSEVIVFRPPRNSSDTYIKRIVGLPNERLVIDNGAITVYNSEFPTGKQLPEEYLSSAAQQDFSRGNQHIEVTLGADEYYVLGDNRGASTDSRVFGPAARDSIIGRSFVRLFPLQQLSVFAFSEDPLDS